MAKFDSGVVRKVVSSRGGVERLKVKMGRKNYDATNFVRLSGEAKVGDRVVVNTTARGLDLGTGGSDFVVWNLEHSALDSPSGGHILKMRYTPGQMDTLVAEAPESPHHDLLKDATTISGMPVVACGLHSQVAPAAAMLKHFDPDLRVAYVMTDGAALPLAHSDLMAQLVKGGLIDGTVTCGHAFGGDLECVNIFTALLTACDVLSADVTIVAPGPGIVGTQTALGHTGMEQGQVISAAAALGGRPIAVLRLSFADQRPRHVAISQHSLTALRFGALARCTIAVPDLEIEKLHEVMESLAREGLSDIHDTQIVDAWETQLALDKFELAPTTMGRSFEDDPAFFEAAGAGGLWAARLIYEIDA